MDTCCWNFLYYILWPWIHMFGHKKYIYIWSGRYNENFIWCGDTVAILKSDIFHCSDSFERGNQFNSISDRTNLQYIKRSSNLNTRLGQNNTKKCISEDLDLGFSALHWRPFYIWSFSPWATGGHRYHQRGPHFNGTMLFRNMNCNYLCLLDIPNS